MVFEDEQTTGIGDAAELTEDELKSGRYTFYTLDGRSAGNNYDALKSGDAATLTRLLREGKERKREVEGEAQALGK